MIAHTPGPWTITQPGNRLWYGIAGKPYQGIADSKGSRIAFVAATEKGVGTANARLIAAAPDLARLLSRLLTLTERERIDTVDTREAYALLDSLNLFAGEPVNSSGVALSRYCPECRGLDGCHFEDCRIGAP